MFKLSGVQEHAPIYRVLVAVLVLCMLSISPLVLAAIDQPSADTAAHAQGAGSTAPATHVERAAPRNNIWQDLNKTLQEALHVVNEVGALLNDFWQAIRENPWQGLKQIYQFLAQLLGLLDSGDGTGTLRVPGPGLGQNHFDEAELFTPLGWVHHDTGIPGLVAGRKPFGSNLGMMIDGYFFTLFAPDSGLGPGGFLWLDISNPREPTLVKRLYEPEGHTRLLREPHAYGMARIDDRRYLAFQNIVGIEIWDFTDLNQPEQVAVLPLPGVDGGDYSQVSWQLVWQAPYLYVAGSEQGIFIVDTHDPTQPVLADRGPGKQNPVPPAELGGFRVGPIFALGNHMIISSMENRDGIASLDISDPLHPQLLDRIADVPQLYYASCFDGARVALSVRGADARMILLDVSNPEQITTLNDQFALPGQLYCAFQDETVFQGTEESAHKIDISNPARPLDLGSASLTGPFTRLVDHGQVSPLGNLLFIGNDHGTGSALVAHAAKPDTLPPSVRITSPRDGSEQQAVSSRIGVAFSDVIDFNSVDGTTLQLLDANDIAVPGTFSVLNGQVNFAPHSPLLPVTHYRIVVPAGGIRDVAGNPIADTFEAQFTTGSAAPALDLPLDISTSQVPGQVGDRLLFDVQLTNAPAGLQYAWLFGDGQRREFATQAAAHHRYDAPGHYQVTLLISDGERTQRETFTRAVHWPVHSVNTIQSSGIAVLPELVVVANPDNDSITAVDRHTYQVHWERHVGKDPQSVARDNAGHLWVALRGDAAIQVVDTAGTLLQRFALPVASQPISIVCEPGQDTCLVSLAAGDAVLRINTQGDIVDRLALASPRAITLDVPRGEAWITRFISPSQGALLYRVAINGPLTLTDTVRLPADNQTQDSQDRARGMANYLTSIALSADGRQLWIAAKKDNVLAGLFRDGTELRHDTSVRAIVPRVALPQGDYQPDQTLDFDDRALPRAVLGSPLGDYLFTALQGSNRISITDAYSGALRSEIHTGLAPQSLALDEDGKLWVHAFMDRQLQVFDVQDVLASRQFTANQLANVKLVSEEALSPRILQGKQIFYNADDDRMSKESYLSCASCHLDGGEDGRVWDFTQRGEGLRNTPSLRGRGGAVSGPLHWTANFDEMQDFENDMRTAFGGLGFLSDADFATSQDPLGPPKAGLNNDLDALAAYVNSLSTRTPSPHRNADNALSDLATAGQALFNEVGCAQCHSGDLYSDQQLHQTGTLTPASGQALGGPIQNRGIRTPPLHELWQSAPFFHQGSAVSLREVLVNPGHGAAQSLSESQLQALEAYLLSL